MDCRFIISLTESLHSKKTELSKINNLLSNTQHRPYPLPSGTYKYYQEWNNAIFLHWKVDYNQLKPLVPETFNLDNFNGDYYISIVAFTMEKIRPKSLPSVGFLSNFHEVNVRTYVENDGKKGVYFINIEAEKLLACFIAKQLSGLPYQKASMKRNKNQFYSQLDAKNFKLNINFEVEPKSNEKSELDLWLTERYCLYLDTKHGNYRYDIHHKEWVIDDLKLRNLESQYQLGNVNLQNLKPDLTHYSKGVEVVAWGKTKL